MIALGVQLVDNGQSIPIVCGGKVLFLIGNGICGDSISNLLDIAQRCQSV